MRWNLLSSAGRRLRNWWEEEGKPPSSSSFGESASPASRQNTSSPSTLTVLNVVMFTPRSDAVLTVPGRHRMPSACLTFHLCSSARNDLYRCHAEHLFIARFAEADGQARRPSPPDRRAGLSDKNLGR